MRKLMTGLSERIVGQGCLYAGVNEVRIAFRKMGWMKDLIRYIGPAISYCKPCAWLG